MDNISSIKNKLISQRGATAIMSAIILPLILAFGGMAVDIGNLYSHHSRLQNAADSAAIAGGHAFRSNKETADDHPYADEAADKYAEKNLPSDINYWVEKEGKNINLPDGRTGSALKVTVYEDVPYHFLRPLFSLLNAPESITISATSYCTLIDIPGKGGTNLFSNLFTFNEYMGSVNNVQNPDNPNIAQEKWNCSTYDGNVVATSDAAFNNTSLRFDVMLQSDAFGTNGNQQITVNEARSRGLVTKVSQDNSIKLDAYYKDNILPLVAQAKNARNYDQGEYLYRNNQNDQNVNTDLINKWIDNGTNVVYYDIPNLNFDLSGTIHGSPTDDPLIIVCENINNFNFSADMKNSRPIMLVYANESQWGNFWMNSNGGEFHGILYAPYGQVSVNDNHHEFYGSIAANKIQLQSQGYFHQEDMEGISSGGDPADVKVVFGGADLW